MQGSKRHPLSSGPTYEYSRRSWTAVEDTGQDSNHGTYEASIARSNPPLHGKLWQTGYLRNVPWRGIGSLLLVLTSTIASAIILGVSNGDAVLSWRVAPSVVLAILSAISTACLSFSLASGLNVSWWRNLLEGAPLDETHRYWDHGNNIWAAMTAGRRFSFLSIAKLLVTLAAITEGPFIQQASTISTREVSKTLSLQAALAVNLPPGYTADVTGEYRKPTTPSSPFSGVFNNYTNRISITNGFDGCPGVCTANVPGVGFKVLCAPDANTTWTMKDYIGNGVSKPQFTTSTTWRAQTPDGNDNIAANGSYEYLTLSAGWAINTVTPLLFVNRVCNLSLAMVSYPLKIVNNTVSLTLPPDTNPEVLYDLPTASTAPGMGLTGSTTLGGFSLIGNVNDFGESPTEGPFYANVSMIANGALAIYSLYGLNSFTWSHAMNSDPDWNVMQYSGYAWRDPVPDILAAYHEIMFRLGLSAATNATLVSPLVLGGKTYTSVRSVSATYVFNENYYVSNYGYLAGAMTVILLAIVSVMSTLRGWWKIGRPTSLSPLETAKAFGAPLLAECNSNDTVEDLVQNAKHQIVKYGATKEDEVGDRGSRLRLEDYGEVHTPRSETTFQQ
ncbi:hypothetical protein G7Y89_g11298 [Cudoniella acicularis]|uniref:Uncharacterized protein n=1 Tax=Cudoniella acicularis TaxID=354080 RepID=A0A8H4RER1_9HELO|nr:hypothetical protein G7Y89_g11298 [Cudoniella acicularis]